MKNSEKKKYKVVIWDVDGTLLDTSDGVIKSVKKVISNNNLRMPSEELLATFIGPPIQLSMKKTYDLSDDMAQNYGVEFRTIYKDEFLYEAHLYPGLLEVLKDMKTRGIKMSIATYKREDYARDIVRHFDLMKFCDACYGADNNNVLSKRDIIKKCIDLYDGVTLDEIVMIGDTDHDRIGAEELGIDFIGVKYGFGYKEGDALESWELVASPCELLKYV